jgi:pimeloyl-ACP methyl ester carboxylesterase
MPTPDTIVLIHGLWLTPLSWEGWIKRYEDAGYTLLAPRLPSEADDVPATRADPSGMNGVGIIEITDHYAKIIEQLEEPPILMGHSFGGLVVQLLLDRGLGAAGVVVGGELIWRCAPSVTLKPAPADNDARLAVPVQTRMRPYNSWARQAGVRGGCCTVAARQFGLHGGPYARRERWRRRLFRLRCLVAERSVSPWTMSPVSGRSE